MPPKRNAPRGAASLPQTAPPSVKLEPLSAVPFAQAISEAPLHLLLRGKHDVKVASIQRSFESAPSTSTIEGVVTDIPDSLHSYMTVREDDVSFTDNLIKGGNCSECEAIVCKSAPFVVVATSVDVQIVSLGKHLGLTAEAVPNVVVPEHRIVHMQLSPLERFLVLYRSQNPNSPTQDGGNMMVYRVQLDLPAPKVTLVMKCVQSAWPAFVFTQDETYAVRYVRGLLVLHDVSKTFVAGGDATVETADNGADESDDDAKAAEGPARALCNLNAGVARGKELVMSLPSAGVKPDGSCGNTLAVFRPFTNNVKKRGGAVGGGVNPGSASLVLYRLPQMQNPGLMAIPLHQAEDVALEWSPDGGNYLCVWIKLDSSAAGGGGGSDYYGKTFLYLIDVRLKKEMLIKFPVAGGAPSAVVNPGFSALAGSLPVHDVKWCPSPQFYRDCANVGNHPSKAASQLFVAIHGEMPHSEATLFNEKGQPLYRFGRSPCNVIHWSPNGAFVALGGFGNLAGDVRICYNGEPVGQFFQQKKDPSSLLVGGLSDKTSEQSWSPDSRFFLTSTLFGKLRASNKVALYKHTGEKVYERRYKAAAPSVSANPDLAPVVPDDAMLFQATWLPVSFSEQSILQLVASSPASFPPPSPRMPAATYARCHAAMEATKAGSGLATPTTPAKVGLFKARGGGSAAVAAALSKGAPGTQQGAIKAAVPVGGVVVEKKKKRR